MIEPRSAATIYRRESQIEQSGSSVHNANTQDRRQIVGTALLAVAFLTIGTTALVNGMVNGNVYSDVAGAAAEASGVATLVSAFKPKRTQFRTF